MTAPASSVTADASERRGQIGIVVLAAGGSSRLGRPKQLLEYEGETLLRRAVRRATESGCAPVVVVLGSQHALLQREAHYGNAQVVVNPDWAEGMGRSIAAGVEAAIALEPDIDGVLITLCDQPLVTSDHLRALVDAVRSSDCTVVATEYDTKQGVPALFARSQIAELRALRGAAGAAGVISVRPAEVTRIPLPTALYDVDTPDDYEKLLNVNNPVRDLC